MSATPQVQPESPQLTVPEASEGMVGPGQEGLVQEFQAEQNVPDKFRNSSREDVIKAYQELERKRGESEPTTETQPTPNPPAESYSKEEAVQVYGSEAVEALASKGLDMADVMYKADSGEDISEHYDTFAETFNVPRQVVENYVNGAQQALLNAGGDGLQEGDVSDLKSMVGGEEGFNQLSAWAGENLNESELAEYNAVVDSGNKPAIQWALRTLAARVQSPNSVVEPKLIGGGDSPSESRFESKQQVLDAMNKRNDSGQRLYDVDEAYRGKVAALLANSDVF